MDPNPAAVPIWYVTNRERKDLATYGSKVAPELLQKIVKARSHKNSTSEPRLSNLDERLVAGAIQKFLDLRKRPLEKKPATDEFLLWLELLVIESGLTPDELLKKPLNQLPYLTEVLVKSLPDLRTALADR